MEVEAKQQTDADCGAVHQAAVDFVLLAVIEEARIDVASPELEIRTQRSVHCQFVARMAERQIVSALHHKRRLHGYFMCLVITQFDGRAKQVNSTDTSIPEFLVGVAQAQVEVEGITLDVV